jgi:uncharacterized phage-associated protein
MSVDYSVRDVMYFVAKKLRCFGNMGKLRLLIFLAQYDVKKFPRRRAVEYRCGGRPLARAEFYIWRPDVVSDEFYEALETISLDMVRTAAGLEFCYGGPAPDLPKPVAERLTAVVDKYGGWKAWQLQRHVKKLLGWDVEERYANYLGNPISAYFYGEGFMFETKELCQ